MMTREDYDAIYAHLRVGQTIDFDVNGFKRGRITRIYKIDGTTYVAVIYKISPGFYGGFERIGLPRLNVLGRTDGSRPNGWESWMSA